MTGRQTCAERAAYPLARDSIRKIAEASWSTNACGMRRVFCTLPRRRPTEGSRLSSAMRTTVIRLTPGAPQSSPDPATAYCRPDCPTASAEGGQR
jgi:hypothetical protein